jgi:hypothetical protein
MVAHLEHALGVLSLGGMAAASAHVFLDTFLPNWPRIREGMLGRPVPPASSIAPLVTSRPRSRAVEAGARSTHQVQL